MATILILITVMWFLIIVDLLKAVLPLLGHMITMSRMEQQLNEQKQNKLDDDAYYCLCVSIYMQTGTYNTQW